jgi:hypothetical protein
MKKVSTIQDPTDTYYEELEYKRAAEISSKIINRLLTLDLDFLPEVMNASTEIRPCPQTYVKQRCQIYIMHILYNKSKI